MQGHQVVSSGSGMKSSHLSQPLPPAGLGRDLKPSLAGSISPRQKWSGGRGGGGLSKSTLTDRTRNQGKCFCSFPEL